MYGLAAIKHYTLPARASPKHDVYGLSNDYYLQSTRREIRNTFNLCVCVCVWIIITLTFSCVSFLFSIPFFLSLSQVPLSPSRIVKLKNPWSSLYIHTHTSDSHLFFVILAYTEKRVRESDIVLRHTVR